MSTNTIIAIIVAAVIVLGGGYYFMSSGSYRMADTTERVGDMDGDGLPDTDQTDTPTNPKMAPSAAAFTGSFFDLATRGGNYTCDVGSAGAANDTTGTVYVSGTNLRGDFTTVAGGKTTTSHMLKLADTMYVWSSAMPQGIMMKATAMMGQSGATAAQGSGVSGTQSYGWNCSATGADASKFAKPTGIDFIDTAALMGGSMPGTGMMPKVPTGSVEY